MGHELKVKVGCDVVDLGRFKKSLERTPSVKGKIFSAKESRDKPLESLAGIFAAKEAVIKALEMKAGDWKRIEIRKNKSGRPEAVIAGLDKNMVSHDISISHDGNYAMAMTVFILK